MDQNMNMGTGAEQMPAEKKSLGIIISIVIVVAVIATGAYYLLRNISTENNIEVLTPEEVRTDATISSLSTQGTSTNVVDIEQDLNATNFSNIDVNLDDIAF